MIAQIAGGAEHDRVGDVGPRGGDLALVADQHRSAAAGADSQKVDVPVGGRGRPELDPDQLEELDVVAGRAPG